MEQTVPAESVIWITSYPKSGNTWLQAVVRVAGKQFGFPESDLDVYKLISDKRSPTVVSGVRPEVGTKKMTVLKTHSRYLPKREIHPELGLETAGFVHVIRNPLDMLLSYINFTRMQETKMNNVSNQDSLFIDLLGFKKIMPYEDWKKTRLEDIPRYNLDHALNRFTEYGTHIPSLVTTGGSWIETNLSWFEAGKCIPSVFFKYEDLLGGPKSFLPLTNIFSFSEQQIIAAADVVNRWLPDQPGKRIFYNKMSSYYYLQFFSHNTITRFLDKYHVELSKLGYENLPS